MSYFGTSEWIGKYENHAKSDFSYTKLSDEEEASFREWFKQTKLYNSLKEDTAKDEGVDVGSIDDERFIDHVADPDKSDYDYRGAFKGGIQEEINKHDNKPHWSSRDSEGNMLKNPKHPTAWKEFFYQQHGVDPDEIGIHTLDEAKTWSKERE
jgi:hypothetical protein